MKDKNHKVWKMTDAKKKKFMEYVYYWQDVLNLSKWSILKTRRKTASLAQCTFSDNNIDKMCRIAIGDYWSIPPTDHNLCLVACHEVLHVLLYDSLEYARKNPNDMKGIIEKEHEVVNTLERVFCGNVEY